MALTEQAKTVTLAHLRKTALSETRVELALRNALESETELKESDGADERLLTLLGLRGQRPNAHLPQLEEPPTIAKAQPRRPGKQGPGRDPIGEGKQDNTISMPNEEQAAG